MLAILIKIDLLSKMLPLGCVDFDYLKGLKNLFLMHFLVI